MAETVEDT
ncbi:hypothetical protein ABFA07_011313 [Porites harrisoni]